MCVIPSTYCSPKGTDCACKWRLLQINRSQGQTNQKLTCRTPCNHSQSRITNTSNTSAHARTGMKYVTLTTDNTQMQSVNGHT